MRVKELVAFIKEREAIRVKKEKGSPRPWTKDPILGKYRFCNVHREDDRVTRWIRQWQVRFVSSEDLWFAFIVARLFNKPETLGMLKECTVPFKPAVMRATLKKLRDFGPIFNAAYIVSTNGVAMDKVDYLIDRVLRPLWAARKLLRPLPTYTLAGYHASLMTFDGLGSFIAAQVVADLKYMKPLKQAPDWWTFAASGPGSRRGLNRVCEREVNQSWNEDAWHHALTRLRLQLNDRLNDRPFPLHAQDLQNCLCEFDKYERARLGEGTPKQIYKERA